MKDNLANLQVIVFSRNRHEQLIESLRYWDKCGIQTLVLHNTSQPLNLIDIPPSTQYLVHQGSFADRCKVVSQVLKHDYFIIASDDERYLPTALANMVMELEENKELASVGGQAIAIMKYGLRFRTTSTYKSQINYQNLASDFNSRFIYHFVNHQNYSGAMYRAFRRDDFRRFLILISKFANIETPYIFEVTSELFWTLVGPSKYIDEVFWVRNWMVEPIQTGDWDRKQYFYEWSQNPNNQKNLESWKRRIIDEFKFLEDHLNFFKIIIDHRMNIEKNEQNRNLELRSRRQSKTKTVLRNFLSIFKSRYQQRALNSQLKNLGTQVKYDELKFALYSITSKVP